MLRDEDRVVDILIAARFLETWLRDRTIESLAERLMLSAVVRELMIIGEAAAHMSPESKARFPGVQWAEIVSMRNILVHSYNNVNVRIVWVSATRDVPELAAMLSNPLSPGAT